MTNIPAFEPQHDEGLRPPLTNCNPASGAMLVDWWTRGQIDTSDVYIRQASGIPVSDGMNFAAVNLGLQRLFPQLGKMLYSEHTGPATPANPGGGNAQLTWNQLLTHMRAGGFACVGGLYKDLPLDLRKWSPSFTGGHMAVAGNLLDDDHCLWGDPLSLGFVRIPIGVLFDYIWSTGKADGNVVVTAAHGFSGPRPSLSRFSDVPPSHWAYEVIEWAAQKGIATGRPDGTFGPDEPASAARILTFLKRYDDAQS